MSRTRLAPINFPWLATDPATPTLRAGDAYGNSGTQKLRVYNGSAWNDVGGSGTGTPASTVVAETGWGQATVVGTSTNYAREDHSHGSQPMPVDLATAQTITGAKTFSAATTFGGTLSGAGIETMEYGLRAGFAVTGGGQLAFDSNSTFSWSARFIVIAAGNGASSTTTGYFDITMPTSGAVAVAGGAGARNWSAAGVVINPWEALWYRLPIGSANGSVPGNFLITGYGSAMAPPSSDYVLLAIRNGDDNYLRTCRGDLMGTSHILPDGSHGAIGLYDSGNRVYSAAAPPPYPVTTVAGRTGAVVLTAADIGTAYAGVTGAGSGYVTESTLNATYGSTSANANFVGAVLSATFTVPTGGRRYKATVTMFAFSSVGTFGEQVLYMLVDGGTNLQRADHLINGGATSHTFFWQGTLTAGSHTLAIWFARAAGTAGSIISVGSSGAQRVSRLLVEDIGV